MLGELNLVSRHVPEPGINYGGTRGSYDAGLLVNQTHKFSFINQHRLQRPYFPDRGPNADIPCVTVNTGRWTTEKGVKRPILQQMRIVDLLNKYGITNPVLLTANATALRKEQWIQLDNTIQKSYRQRLKAWADLLAASPLGGFNAMAKMTYEYQVMSDPHEALVDMDALSDGRGDTPLFLLRSVPLAITHSDFHYSQRMLDVSGGNGQPLSMDSGEAAARRIGELVEKTLIGVETGVTYGTQSTGITAHNLTSTVFGYTNYTNRNTKTNFTAPTAGGWTPETTYNEILTALSTLMDDYVYGPFMLYYSTDWHQYMHRMFSVSGGNTPGENLRDRILKIEDIADVRRLDFLTSTFTLILVSMTSDVAQAINGMDVTTVQWPTVGGLQQNYKVMVIQVPLLKSDYSGKCGILHGTTA